ncbi:MAG: hypothetical protein A2W25_11955 [candidate division Zixibacteria bacterium RBG_16_53_22]|nr:MAG: hypothetical protein A2W25_11955 [candidate division Zixibacteria bacterium RBG_16_53_22]
MAVSQEIFRATLTVETNIVSAIEGLEKLSKKAIETLDSLQKISTAVVKPDLGGLNTISTTIEKATKDIRADFERLRQEVVGKSIIPEMIDAIAKEFDRLPNKTAPEVKKLHQQFEQLKTSVKPIEDAIAGMDASTRKHMEGIVAEALKMKGAFSDDQIKAAMASIGSATAKTGSEVQGTIGQLNKLAEAVRQVYLTQKPPAAKAAEAEIENRAKRAAAEFENLKKIGEKTFADYERQGQKFRQQTALATSELGEAAQRVTAFEQRFRAIGQVAAEGSTGFRAAVANIRGGFQLMAAEGGNFALGLRQAFFGLSGSTNVLGRALDWLGGRHNELSRATGKLEQETLRIDNIMRRFTTGMRDQMDVLKEVGKEEGVQKAALSEIDVQVKRVEKAFKDMNTTIVAGGKPTEQQMARIREEVRILEQSYRQLKVQGIIPAGSATDDMFKQMLKGIETQRVGSNQMIARVIALRKEVEKAEQSEKQSNATSEKRVGIFQRVSIAFSNLFNITRNVTNETKNFNQQLDQTGAKMGVVARTADVAKGAFVGFVGAAAAITGLRYAIDGIGFAIRNLGGKFLEVNNTAQNFGITLTNMLRGSKIEDQAEEVVGGAMDFIKEAVAATPFELADAIEAFQRLIIAGLDPKQWMEPIADAAAIMNKPMDQLIGAFQRLTVGDTGQALMMMRDFGINVNRAAVFVDQATGNLLSYDQAQQAVNMSAEQLAAKGWAKLNLEFSKGGELTTDTATALKILNGYLTQNSTIAGTAASRSLSLQGVMSNLKDSVSNLFIEMGKPIMEKLTGAGSGLLDKINELQPVLNALAANIGVALSGAIDFAINFISNFKENFAGLIEVVQTVISIVASIFAGDWQNAWFLFLDAIDVGLSNAVQFLDSWISNAFTWGWNFVVEIANGVLDSASSVLMEALNSVGEMISSFLAPGSAPEVGPLSTIDEWGAALMDIFGAGVADINDDNINTAMEEMKKLIQASGGQLSDGFYEAFSSIDFAAAIQNARAQLSDLLASFANLDMSKVLGSLKSVDFSFIRDALSPVKDFFKTMGSEGTEPFLKVRDSMAAIVAELNATGEINEEAFAKIGEVLGDQNKEMTKYLRLQLELHSAQRKLQDVQGEVAAAEARGFVPAALKAKLAAAEKDVEDKKEAVDWQKEYVAWQKEGNQLQQEFVGGLDKAAKAMGKAASAAGSAAKAQAKQIETLAEWYAREKALIEEKYRLGVIGEQEYVQALLNLEKQYVDRSLEEGIPAGLDAHVQAIKELELRLEGLKEKTKEAQGQASKGIEMQTPAEILGKFAKNIQEIAQQTGGDFADGFVLAMREGIPRNVPGLMADIWAKILEGFVTIFNNIRNFLAQNVTPQNFPIFAVVAGLFTQLAASPIMNFVTRLAARIAPVIVRLGGLRGILLKLLGVLGRAALLGGIIITIFLNWDKIVAALSPVITSLSTAIKALADEAIAAIIERMGGAEQAAIKFNAAYETMRSIVAGVGEVFNMLITSGFSEIGQAIEGAFKSAVMAMPTQGISGAISTFFTTLISSLSTTNIGQAITNLFTNAVAGIRETILPIFSDVLGGIGTALGGLVPPGVVDTFNQLRQSIAAFFEEGRLGGEIVRLFGDLKELMVALAPIAKALLSVLAALAGLVANSLVAAFQTIIDILPNIEGFFAGLVRIVRGVLDVVSGLATLIQSAWALITGDTEKAQTLFQTAIGQIGSGLGEIFSGITLAVSNAAQAILGFPITFISHFVDNIIAFLPQGSSFSQTLQAIGGAISSLKDILTGALEAIGSGISAIGMVISDFLSGQISFQEAWNQIKTIFASTVDAVSEALAPLGQALLDGILNGVEWLRTNAPIILQTIGAWVTDTLVPGIASFAASLATGFVDLFGKAVEYVGANWPTWLETLNSYAASIIAGVVTFVTTTLPVWASALATKVGELFQAALDYVQTNWPAWSATLNSYVGPIIDGIIIFFTATLPTWITDLITKFGELVQGLLIYVGQNWQTWAIELAGFMGNVFGYILTGLVAIPYLIIQLSGKFLQLIQGLIDYASQNWPTWAAELGTHVASIISSVVTFVTTTLPTWIADLSAKLSELITGFLAYAGENWQTWAVDLAGFVGKVFGYIIIGLVTIPYLIIQLIGKLAELIQGLFSGADEKEGEWGTTLGKTIGKVFAGVVTWLIDNGPTIASDLFNGFKDVIAALWTFITATLPEWSVQLADFMSQLMTAFGKGMLESAPWLADALAAGQQFVDNIKAGIEAAWIGIVTWFAGKVQELLAPILGARETIENAWSGLKEGVTQPVEGAKNAVVGAFGGLQEGISSTAENATGSVIGFFDNLRNTLVGNSIVPEMTTAIVTNFTTMDTTLSAGLTTFTTFATSLWQQFTQNILIMWQDMVQFVIELAQQLEEVLTEIIQRIVELFNAWREAVDKVIEGLKALPEPLGALAEYIPIVDQLADKFNDLYNKLKNATSQAEKLAKALEKVNSMGGNMAVSVSGAAQGGLWRVPSVSTWTLHPGEMVLPAGAAEAFRSFAGGGLPAMGMPATESNSGLNKQYIFGPGAFQGAFPGVRTAHDAEGLLNRLDQLAQIAELKGRVVS